MDYLSQASEETNKESLLKMIEEDRPGVARIVAGSKHATAEILEKLMGHSSRMVRVLVARNLNTPTDVLKAMTLDSEVSIRDSATTRPSVTTCCDTYMSLGLEELSLDEAPWQGHKVLPLKGTNRNNTINLNFVPPVIYTQLFPHLHSCSFS